MSTRSFPSILRLTTTAALGLLLTLSACASHEASHKSSSAEPVKSAEIVNDLTATAAVIEVDRATRVVTLQREDGSLFQVVAGSEVRNLDQVDSGDTLRVRYKETLKASLRPKGEPAKSAEAGLAALRANPGSTPAAGVGMAVSVRVKIESIDLPCNIVTYSLSSGELISRRLATEEGRRFAKGLKIGDTVQLDYTQALALTVEKV